jgi:hypothetical protein
MGNVLELWILATPDNPDIFGGPGLAQKANEDKAWIVNLGAVVLKIKPTDENTVTVTRLR